MKKTGEYFKEKIDRIKELGLDYFQKAYLKAQEKYEIKQREEFAMKKLDSQESGIAYYALNSEKFNNAEAFYREEYLLDLVSRQALYLKIDDQLFTGEAAAKLLRHTDAYGKGNMSLSA